MCLEPSAEGQFQSLGNDRLLNLDFNIGKNALFLLGLRPKDDKQVKNGFKELDVASQSGALFALSFV